MRALIAILLLPTAAFCQGRFTTGDASSMGIGAGLSFGDNTTALSFTLGTSLAGAVDGSVGMILSNVDEVKWTLVRSWIAQEIRLQYAEAEKERMACSMRRCRRAWTTISRVPRA